MIIDAHYHMGKVGEEGILAPPELNARFKIEMTKPFFPPGAANGWSRSRRIQAFLGRKAPLWVGSVLTSNLISVYCIILQHIVNSVFSSARLVANDSLSLFYPPLVGTIFKDTRPFY